MNSASSAVAESEETRGGRRSLRNFLFKPMHQIRYGYYMVAAGVLFMGTTGLLILRKMTHIDALLNQGAGEAVPYEQLTDLFADVTATALFGFFASILFSCSYAMVVSHRVAGPITAIIGCIEKIQQGDYEYRQDLRQHDELKPIHHALRDLAATLRERSV